MPDLGEGLTESEIVNWHIAVGDTVTLNQVIADVETAKAVVELPSPYEGIVSQLHEAAGSVVAVGAPIVSFDVGGAAGSSAESAAPDSLGEDEPQKRTPNLVGYGAVPEKAGRPARRRPASGNHPPAVPAPVGEQGVPPQEPRPSKERPRSTPPVRKLARDLGINLEQVEGTGPDGLIVRHDVTRAAEGMSSPAHLRPSPAVAPAEAGPGSNASRAGSRETRIPIAGMRKHTAAAMVASAFTAPHVTVFLTVDVTASVELLTRLRTQPAFEGLKLTPLTLAAKAVCLALARHPSLNSRWDESAREIVHYGYVNLGIAAATPRGLMVPNVKDAQALGLRDLAAALGSLAQTARAGKTTPADLAGGTFSISNVGVFGIDSGTPVLNPGEAGILALGAVREQPWAHEGALALRQVMTLSLSFDHRLVDGEQGARFLSDVGLVLSEPAMALALA
nr:dihydrolipoamide acetyltransferase family protein [Arthrobacter jiangjiafuii]